MNNQENWSAELSTEVALLQCLLMDPALQVEIEIAADDFVSKQHGAIFRAIKTLTAEQTAVDMITVAEHLSRDTGRNWMPTIAEICASFGSRANVKAYAAVIKQAANNRKAAQIGNFLMENSAKEGVISDAIKMLMEIGKDRVATEYDLNQVMKLSIAEVDRAMHSQDSIIGVSTGLKDLDDILGGYHKGDLVIIGARPAVGKTAVMLNQMIGANQYVGCISGEQGVAQLGQRLLSMAGKVSLMSMRNGRMKENDWNSLLSGATLLKNHPGMKFNDRASPSMDEVESCARRWKFENDIKALYGDYLQKFKTDPGKKRHEAVGDNVRRLKDLARELDIPTVILAQLSREADGRRPTMRDLADSSEIEKEADLIILLYREEDSGKMEFIICKNRHGPTGVITAQWDGRFLKIADLAFESRKSA